MKKKLAIKILQPNTIRIVDVSSSMKLALASKVESVISGRNKGKEAIPEPMQTSDEGRSDLMETDDELPIQLGSIPPSNFSMNMAFTLPATFRAKEGKSPVIKGDIEDVDMPTAKFVN